MTNRVELYKCMIKYIDKAQRRYYKKNKVSAFDNTPFMRFIGKCIGPKRHNLKYSILRRYESDLKKRERVKAGKTYVSPQCEGVPEVDCTYPCTWINERNRCEDIPRSYDVPE